MSKHPMFDPKFDPYNELILLNQKMDRLEQYHNRLARDYQITQHELTLALEQVQTLQKSMLTMSKLVNSIAVKNAIK